MINKKIASEFGIGIILLVAIIMGGSVWLQSRKIVNNQEVSPDKKQSVIVQPVDDLKIDVPSGWKLHKNDVLGIQFIYPEYWGQPKTEPVENITNLNSVTKDYADEENDYYDSVYIRFSPEESDDTWHVPTIKFFGDKYRGEYYGNTNAHEFGYINNIQELKKTGDICSYKVDFNTEYQNTLSESFTTCKNNVKETLIKEKEVFDDGALYSYDLDRYSFFKLHNGFFDNVLIKENLAYVLQTKKLEMNMDASL